MKSYALQIPVGAKLVCAGVLLVLVGVAGKAQASCGDYVVIGSARHAPRADGHAKSTLPLRNRCHGPACRRDLPATPQPPPPIHPTTWGDHWAMNMSTCPAALRPSARNRIDRAVTMPDGFPQQIDRPPEPSVQPISAYDHSHCLATGAAIV